MRVLLGVLSLMILSNLDGALFAGSDDSSTLREEISESFNPYDVSYEEMGASAFLGTTIVSNYAGSSYFFGTGNLWNAVNEVAGPPDNVGTFAQLFPNDTSRFLYTRDFMFDIPCNATITSLTVRVTRQNSTTIDVSDALIALYNPLTLSTSAVNMADPSLWVEDGSWETITYTHPNWGETLTPELLNNRRFGVIVTAQHLGTSGLARAFVDAIEIEACYDVGAPISEPISFAADKQDACFDEGYIEIFATGGSGSYEYSIDNGVTWQTNPLFSNLSSGDYVIIVRNTDGTCATQRFYCNLSSDDRILQPGDAIAACATFPGNRITLGIEKVQPFNELYNLGETGYDISYLLPNHPFYWEVDDLEGEVYSFDIDRQRNIYTAVTMLYDLVPGFDVVPYVNKIDAFSGQAYILNVLPGDSGAGGVEYDTICEQLYIANLSDGMIYRMDPNNGVILSTFDPLNPDNGADGIAPLGERIIALGWNHVDQRIYYSVWASDFNKTGLRNTIRSVAIDPVTCDFDAASDRLEITLPWTSEYGDPLNPEDYSMPVGDIEFSTDGGTMLLAETGFDSNVPRSQPHESRVMRYTGSGGSWTLSSTPPPGNTYLEYEIGEVSAGLNARGGVDFANSGFTNNACSDDLDEFIVATGDALRGADCNTLGCIYGFQYLPITGSNPPNSVLLDIARNVGSQQKGIFGDVDIVQGCFTDEFCCPDVDSPAPDQDFCVGVGGLTNVSVTSQADSMSLVYFTSIPNDSIAIYENGIPLDTVGLVARNGTLDISGLPTDTPGTFYVYAIVHPAPAEEYCRPYDSLVVTINPGTPSTITDPADQCIDGSDMAFTGAPLPGGLSSATFNTDAPGGLTDNGDGTALLDISVAGVGTWEVFYFYTDSDGCVSSDTASVTIFDLPTVTINDPADPCVDASLVSYTGTPVPGAGTTGVFSTSAPSGLTDNGDGTASFDPAAAGVGTYDVSYTYTDINGCVNSSTSSITVNPLPVAGITDPADECVVDGPMNFTGSPLPGGGSTGVFSTTATGGLTDNGDGTASLDVGTAGAGVYDVTYTFTDINGCVDTETVSVEVFDTLANVQIDPGFVCGDPNFGGNVIDLNSLITFGPLTGTWADTDGTGALSGSVFTANAGMQGNSYTFTYTITGPGPIATPCQIRSFTTVVNVVYCNLDVALIKTTSQTTPVLENDVITYDFTICNQGFTTVDSLEITDYIASCYGFTPNNGWVDNGSGDPVRTLTIANGGLPAGGLTDVTTAPDNCITISLDLSITCGDPANLINYGEITAHRDTDGNTADFDSAPGSDTQLERDVLPGSADDDSFSDTNEDDHDPATVPVADIALRTTILTPGPYSYGQTITFDIELINQGNVDLRNIDVVNYIPCGLGFSPSNTPQWTDLGGSATVDVASLDVGQTTNVTIDLIVLEGGGACALAGAWLSEAEVFYMEDEIGTDLRLLDYDSTLDNVQGNDAGGAPGTASDDSINGDGTGAPGDTSDLTDEDDADVAFLTIYDLALTKNVTSVGPYGQDSTVTYELIIENQGDTDASNIQIFDDPEPALVYVTSDAGSNPNVNEITPGTWEIVSLPVGGVEVINITFTIGNQFQGLNVTNYAQIIADDGFDADSDPNTDRFVDEDGDGDGDDDDEDAETIMIEQFYDLTLSKNEISVGPYFQSSLITYEIVVSNTGTLDANNVVFIDNPDPDLRFVSDDAFLNANVNSLGGMAYEIISLPFGSSESIQITFEVDSRYQGFDITNRAQITLDDGDDVDSDPSTDYNVDEDGDLDPDDDDEDTITLDIEQTYDLALTKSQIGGATLRPGDNVTYRITVSNEGSLDANNIVVADMPDADFIFVSDNTGSNPNVNELAPMNYEIVSLPFGSSESFDITLQIDGVYQLDTIRNRAQIVADDGDDIDSDPDTDDTVDEDGDLDPDDDDEDIVETPVEQIYDLSIQKTLLTPGPFLPGSVVTFDINIVNEGTLNAANIEITELPAAAFIYQSNTTGADPNIVEVNPALFNIVSLPAYTSTNFQITYQVDPTAFVASLNNIVMITLDDGDDIDSDPSTDFTVDEDGDLDGFDDDEDISTVVLNVGYEIGDYVWEDYDGDGIQDFNEQGISGVFVELYNAQGFFLDRVQTNDAGFYLFEEVYPGDYYIQFIMPTEDYSPTFFDRGGDDNLDSDVTGEFGEGTTDLFTVGVVDDFSIDAGLIRCAPVGGLVWFDYNKNDRWDPTENGINQLRVEIYRQINGEFLLWDVTYTDHKPGTPSDDGFYKFCVNPGTYYMKFVDPPSTLVPVVPNIGFDDNMDSDVTSTYGTGTTPSFTVYSGQENCTIGAGYYVMGTIGDYVWYDNDSDGRRDVNEQGVQGVEIQAIDIEGNMVAQATTDANGQYMIDYLGKNTYFLHFDIPDGYAMTVPNQGGDESLDSDVDNSNGLHTTKYYIVQPGDHIEHVDAGLVSSVLPVVWRDVWGENRGVYNYIEWQVESEFNVQFYDVERSLGSIDAFQSIGQVEAKNDYSRTLTYSFEDENLDGQQVHYYRIKQVDLDGRFTYSKIVAISPVGELGDENKVALYPNPVFDQLTVEFSLIDEITSAEIDVYDELGRLVRQGLLRTSAMDRGVHKYNLDVNDMQHGIYTLKIKIDNSIYVRKVIILAH